MHINPITKPLKNGKLSVLSNYIVVEMKVWLYHYIFKHHYHISLPISDKFDKYNSIIRAKVHPGFIYYL